MSPILVDITENSITITDTSGRLKTNEVSQINYFGFAKASKTGLYKLEANDFSPALIKLLDYFKKKNIDYSLSPACQKFRSLLLQEIETFKEIKSLGKIYKEGTFDANNFNNFLKFVHKNISRQLKEHQLKAAFHLYLVKNGANFSVPGSGKTSVVLTVYEKLKLEERVNSIFVVGPVACFGPWTTEFELTLGRVPDHRILAGGDREIRKEEYFNTTSKRAELYLTTYQTLLNDQEEVLTFFRFPGASVFLVIDEAHYIKQIEGSWANAVLRLSEHAKYRCILTGTPLPRSYTDVFNLFDFLWPNYPPVDSKKKITIKMDEEEGNIASIKETLNECIGAFFYRVRKADLKLKPPVFHPPRILQMNTYERLLYDAIEKKIRTYAKQDYLRNIDLVKKLRRGRIIRLRQCVSYIKLLSSVLENYDEDLLLDEPELSHIIRKYDDLEIPAKLGCLEKMIKELQQKQQKVVIWANFIGTLDLIKSHLRHQGFYCELIYGKTPIEQVSVSEEKTRAEIRESFVDQKSGLDILIANPAACAESISLHKTCYNSVYYDLSYNCAHYLQSLDRIHRVGGSEKKQANYHFLQYENTIDQDIKNNLEKKAKRMYDIIDTDYAICSLDMFEPRDDDVKAFERLFGENDVSI